MPRDEIAFSLEKLRDKEIVLVDDEISFANLLIRVTKPYRIRFSHAVSGKEASKVIGERTPDVILLDINLPDMSGLDLARLVRQNKRTKSVPIIAISGSSEQRETSFQNGCSDFIEKPFALAELLARVVKSVAEN